MRHRRAHGLEEDCDISALVSRLHEAEQKLRLSEARFYKMVDTAATGVAISEPHGRYLQVNAAYCRILGYTERELLGRNFAEVTHPDDVAGNKAMVEDLLAGRCDNFVIEKRYIRKSGEIRWVRASVSEARTASGEIATLLVLVEDITEQRVAEAASARWLAIVEASDDAIIGKNLDGIVTSWNKGAEKIFGYTAAEMAGTSITRIIPPDRPDEEAGILERIRSGQSVLNFETRRLAKDGRLIDVSITASPIRSVTGEIIGVSKVARDIGLTKKSEARFRRLVESNAQGVFFFTRTGEIIGANDAFLALTGYTREDLSAGRLNWVEMTPAEYHARNQYALDELAAGGICTTFEKEFNRKDGTRVPILLGAAMFEDNPDEGVSFVVDLTERKKLEKQFRHAQKMEGIGTLAGGVAHDFNNILAVIQVQADFLKAEGGLNEEQLESAGEILAAVERAAALTRQLLLFSSREAFRPHELDLSTSITSTIRMLKRLVGEQIDIQFEMAPQPMFIHADPGMIDQVVLNLVVNACDAMADGGRLVIATESVRFAAPGPRAGVFVCLSVRDNGCGIAPEILPAIFEPFFTTKETGKGTGLGLATVFGIVQQHRGWIDVESAVGRGTEFRIYLPQLVRCEGPPALRPSLKIMHGGSETILLAEDDPMLRASVRTTLSRLGYHVIDAANGAAALGIWRQKRDEIKLLLTDMVMPGGMTGKILAAHIRQENPALKVIYMSGYCAEIVPLRDGADFIAKPFQAHRLAALVRRCLDGG